MHGKEGLPDYNTLFRGKVLSRFHEQWAVVEPFSRLRAVKGSLHSQLGRWPLGGTHEELFA